MLLQWQRAWKEGPCSISFWPARKYTYIYYYYTVLIYMYVPISYNIQIYAQWANKWAKK